MLKLFRVTAQGGAHSCKGLLGIRFVASTRRCLFVRPEDGVLILYPNSYREIVCLCSTPCL